ncbi:MAG: methylmalonyl Co-A mutase-associated GTPase MeaB [Bacteroidales bacterium]
MVNAEAVKKFRGMRRQLLKPQDYIQGILQGNRTVLSQAITLVESALPGHQAAAQEIIMHCLPQAGKSLRIGITGVPGVGKSTFIEVFGKYLTSQGHKVAVLAIDPSSQRSKGSILGDKTRMEALANDPDAFIRPSPSAGSLGGVARKSRETLILCEAAGFDIIIIETVGVGQSETAVHGMVDFFLLLMLPGAGDELQGIKRGIMEMADAILINKADGDQLPLANLAKAQYQNALHLFPPAPSGWTPRVEICSARAGSGIDASWELIREYRDFTLNNGYFGQKRLEQSCNIMYETIDEQLKHNFYRSPQVNRRLQQLEKEVRENRMSSYIAAMELLAIYTGNK